MKRGQEEIVGFIIIVILVSIIGLVLLAFSIRDGGEAQGSSEAKQLLESSMEFSTSCAIGYIPAYSKIGRLIRECNTNSAGKCVDGRQVCDALNSELKGIFENSIKLGSERPVKGYEFRAVYELDGIEDEINSFKEGDCSGNIYGAEYPLPENPGGIVTRLEFCF